MDATDEVQKSDEYGDEYAAPPWSEKRRRVAPAAMSRRTPNTCTETTVAAIGYVSATKPETRSSTPQARRSSPSCGGRRRSSAAMAERKSGKLRGMMFSPGVEWAECRRLSDESYFSFAAGNTVFQSSLMLATTQPRFGAWSSALSSFPKWDFLS